MNYSSFPTINPQPTPGTSSNQVSAKNIYGSGTLGGSTVLNLGGPTGVTIDGVQGIFAGAEQFANALFSVDLAGNMKASSLTLSGYLKSGEAAADINTNTTTVNGNKITNGTITSSQIASSTITNSQIADSTITGSKISGSTITADKLTVTSLSALSANLGTVTAGTLTGATIQTATTGQRVVMSPTYNQIQIYNSSNSLMGQIYGDTGGLYFTNPNGPFTIGSGTLGSAISCSASNLIIVGPSTLGITITSTVIDLFGDTTVFGNLSATGTKPFDIPHPDGTEKKRLRYVAIEAPEVLVVCRGKGKVIFPKHFLDVSVPGTIEVIKSGWFWKRNWIATAIRKGYDDFEPEYFGESADDWPGK